MAIIPVDPYAKKLESFDSKSIISKKETIEKKEQHEKHFEGLDSAKKLKDIPVYDKIKMSFADLKEGFRLKSTLEKADDKYGLDLNIEEGTEKSKDNKFVILSIIDVVERLSLEGTFKGSASGDEISMSNNLIALSGNKDLILENSEGNEKQLHYNEAINDPDYSLLEGLKENGNISSEEFTLILDKLEGTSSIIGAIDKSDLTNKNIIKLKISKVLEKIGTDKEKLTAYSNTYSSLELKQGDEVMNLLYDNFVSISGGNGKLDINMAINRSLNIIIHNKVIPNRYSTLMNENIKKIREGTNIRDKVDALRMIFLNVNGIMGFHGKAMLKVNDKMNKEVIEEEDLKDMYKKVIGILLKKNSENKEDKLKNGMNKEEEIKRANAEREKKEKAALNGNLFEAIGDRGESNDKK